MFRPLLTALCCTVPLVGFAQIGAYGGYTVISTGHFGTVPPEYATWLESDVDERPVFPGGEEALAHHFTTVQGCDPGPMAPSCLEERKVLVWFIVEQDGSVQEAWIDRGGCDALQHRTICAVLNMPIWTPGRRKGEAVRTRLRIPVLYEALADTP